MGSSISRYIIAICNRYSEIIDNSNYTSALLSRPQTLVIPRSQGKSGDEAIAAAK